MKTFPVDRALLLVGRNKVLIGLPLSDSSILFRFLRHFCFLAYISRFIP